MAFASTILGRGVFGGSAKTWGTWSTSSTETGGDINTGLHSCQLIQLTPTGSGATLPPTANESFPCDGTAVTIVQDASGDGLWEATGDFY